MCVIEVVFIIYWIFVKCFIFMFLCCLLLVRRFCGSYLLFGEMFILSFFRRISYCKEEGGIWRGRISIRIGLIFVLLFDIVLFFVVVSVFSISFVCF